MNQPLRGGFPVIIQIGVEEVLIVQHRLVGVRGGAARDFYCLTGAVNESGSAATLDQGFDAPRRGARQ